MFMYVGEHVVIGPVIHVYAWRATAEKLCPTMVLRHLTQLRTVVHGKKLQAGSGLRNHPKTS
jgi:hypothetical protein